MTTPTLNNAIRDALGDIVDTAVTALGSGFNVLKLDNAYATPDEPTIGSNHIVAILPAMIDHQDMTTPSIRECIARVQVDMRVFGERYDDAALAISNLIDKIGEGLFAMDEDWATDDIIANKCFTMQQPTYDVTAEPSSLGLEGAAMDSVEASITISATIFKTR